MAAQASIAVVGIDPDKRHGQCHISHGVVDPRNILKEIVDVAISDLIAGDPTTPVFLIRETLAFKKFYIAIINSHGKSLCLVSINVDRLFMRGTINEQG